jgi:starch phosphorylase
MTSPGVGLNPNDNQHQNVDGYEDLAELALDMRWSWNHRTDGLWRSLDRDLWNLTKNPWIVLQTASREQVRHVLEDPVLRQQVEELLRTKRLTEGTPAWFQKQHAGDPLTCIAYFSMEFMLSEALPIYSGGLGNVAGDQLKTASDLGVPVVGVGLLYQRGYFRQMIDQDGAQQALYPYNDPGQLPITPLRQANGEWLRLEVALPGYSVWLRAWQVQVGRVKLYLLDSNDAANYPAHRAITGDLYGGDPEMRLKQELVLGIGGWRLLEAIGLKPEVCHLNEGHAAFAVLERARGFMQISSQPFDVALAVTRAGNLFTTHTAVAAGFDRYPPDLIARYLGRYALKLGLDFHDLLALGRRDAHDAAEPFNMAYLAMRGSGSVNGVSRLHGQVSRHLFEPLFPGWPAEEIPIGHVTNGVHMPSWDSAQADDLWTNACGKDRWLGTMESMEQDLRKVSDSILWACRCAARTALVGYAREHLSRQLAVSGASSNEVDQAKLILDPNALTLGFARRFATYKRPDLLLHDRDRLLRILSQREQPVQLIIAGKAHPADHAGQALIQEWTRFIRDTDARTHVIFLSDYDMRLSEQLVQGVDVWINTPRRPWEACGTSGMKVLVNGGLNLSELDGWWAEAYTPAVGWALGDGQEHGDDPAWDAIETTAIFDLLERAVIPEFHDRNHTGIPVAWVARMRESMARLTPAFSANRTVREYTDKRYLPAAAAFRQRAADHGALGRAIIDWRHRLDQNWSGVRFGEATTVTRDGQHDFVLRVFLHDLDPEGVRVELYAMGVAGGEPVRQEMTLVQPQAEFSGAHCYHATVPTSRPAGDYTGRVMPRFDGIAVPAEEVRIRWQR